MMSTFTVLDTFGCAGGATAGYQRAGAHVTAVDTDEEALEQSPADVKIVADAVEFTREHGGDFDLRAGSPPCQPFTRGNVSTPRIKKWPRLIAPWREACLAVGGPYVLENVEQAADQLVDPVLLCGRMFDREAFDTHPDARGMRLVLDRHRLFETNWGLPQPHHPTHKRTTGIGWGPDGERVTTGQPHVAGVYGSARRDPWEAKYVRHGGYVPKDLDVLRALLGTPWIRTERYLFEAIPPAYTEWVARQFLTWRQS